MVKRYARGVEHRFGSFVEYCDYEALEDKIENVSGQALDSFYKAEELEEKVKTVGRERDALIEYLKSRSVQSSHLSHYENFLCLNPEFAKEST